MAALLNAFLKNCTAIRRSEKGEVMEDAIYITEHKDSDYFKKLRVDCWEAASNDHEFNISQLPPPEYKYFSELYFLFNDLHHGKITKDNAEKKDKLNYEEFTEYLDNQLDYIHKCAIINDNIRRAGTLLSDIEKSSDIREAAFKAFEAVGCMTGDSGFLKRQINKFMEE